MDFSLIVAVLCPAAVIGLGVLVMRLIYLLEERQAHRRVSAILKSTRRGQEAIPELVQALTDPNATVRIAAIEALGSLGAVQALLEAALLHDRDDRFRRAITVALAEIGPEATPPLLEALHHVDWRVRRVAFNALRRQGVDAVPILIEALGNAHPDVRIHAAWLLGQLRDKRAITALLNVLLDPTTRAWALGALTRIGFDPLPALLHALNDPDSEIRQAIAETLGDLGDHRAVPYLQAVATQDENPQVRQSAANALALIRSMAHLTAVYGVPDNSLSPWAR